MTKCPVCGLQSNVVEGRKEGLARTLEPAESKKMFRCPYCGFRAKAVAQHEKQERIKIVQR